MPNRKALADRVARAAEAALVAQGYVSPVDVLTGVGWLDSGTVERWRQGQSGQTRSSPQFVDAQFTP
jgi:hypothetical protein